MASSFLDVCRFNPTLGGTTDWTYSSAVTGYLSPSVAGAINGAIYSYRAENNALTEFEEGFGAYNSATGVFSRTTVLSNSLGTTAKINFTSVPQVAIEALSQDLLAFNAAMSLTTAQQSQAKQNLGVAAVGQCILTKVSTNLVLSPRDGNLLTINGAQCTVPDAGVSLAATSLTPSTNYYIYATASAGAVGALEASTTVPVISTTAGNKGVRIKTGDDARTLVGFARIIAGPAWVDSATQRFVRSWFNDSGVRGEATSAGTAITSTTAVVVDAGLEVDFLSWTGEKVETRSNGAMHNNTSLTTCFAYPTFNGTIEPNYFARGDQATANNDFTVGFARTRDNLTEGLNVSSPFAKVSSNTMVITIDNEVVTYGHP